MTFSPTVMRRRLSRALTRLRADAGIDAADVASRLGWSPSKLTTMERDQWKRPNPRDIKDLLDIYGVTDQATRDSLAALARHARARGWWFEYRALLRGDLVEFEAGATTIRNRESAVIPGLLQTADYARAIFEGGMQDRVDDRVAIRMRRQQILADIDLCAVIDEAALRRRVGSPDVMRDQLRHLAEMADRPNVGIRIVGDDAGAHPAMGASFMLLDFAEDPSMVYLEHVTESAVIDDRETVATYEAIYDRLKGVALSAEESRERLKELAAREG